MCSHPAGSSQPMSPVRYHPSWNDAAVSESGRYPAMADGLRTSISPVAPASSTAPVSGSVIRTSSPGTGRPTLSRRHWSGSAHRVHRDHRHFTGAVGGEPAHAGSAGDGTRDLLGHRRRAPHDVAQRGQVEVLQPRMVRHAERDRRDRHLERQAVLADRPQRRVEVEARCRRTRAPAATAVTMLSNPRMCTGGVAIWKRSRSVSPSAVLQCSTAWPSERCVWRTAFGKPVVPELNTSTASASGSSTADPGSAGCRQLAVERDHREGRQRGGQRRASGLVADARDPGRRPRSRAGSPSPSTPG